MQGLPEYGKFFDHFDKNTLFLAGQEYPSPNENLVSTWEFEF